MEDCTLYVRLISFFTPQHYEITLTYETVRSSHGCVRDEREHNRWC